MKIFGVESKALDVIVRITSLMLAVCLMIGLGVIIINAAMVDAMSDSVLDISEIDGEGVDCVLILGAGLKADGTPNHMLEDRLKVGIEVSRKLGIDYILMSGDDSGEYYNEPAAMKKYAMEQGVPESHILIDGQGFSTYESITRALDVYGFDNVIIITQEYHLYRAIHIADRCEIQAVGVSADLRPYSKQLLYDVREIFARIKDFFQCK